MSQCSENLNVPRILLLKACLRKNDGKSPIWKYTSILLLEVAASLENKLSFDISPPPPFFSRGGNYEMKNF